MEFAVRIDPSDETSLGLLERLAERAEVRPMEHGPGTALVLGGARSGKSAWAEAQMEGVERVDYVATAERFEGDAEWEHRIATHRARRPAAWRTVETTDLEAVLAEDDDAAVLIDCAALWLTRVLTDAGAWDDAPGWRERTERRMAALAEAFESTQRNVIIVSNEVGSGVVPEYASGRIYRDELGRLNARLASVADEVWLSTAGITRRIK